MLTTQTTSINGVISIIPKVFTDDRGSFFQAFHHQQYQDIGIDTLFVQDNQSYSKQGCLRGLHYQESPHAQAKLIRVLQGEIYDVAVDLKPDSPTFGQWHGQHLSSNRNDQLYIPNHCAHGFYVLSETATVLYKCDHPYHPASERSLRWDDPRLNIQWPILSGTTPILSEKDHHAPTFHPSHFHVS